MSLLPEVVEQLDDLPEPLDIEERDDAGTRGGGSGGGVGGPAHRDGGVGPLGQAANEVRIGPSTATDDIDALAGERMMRMGARDGFRRRLGPWGNVL
jgi:hypothetical protein